LWPRNPYVIRSGFSRDARNFTAARATSSVVIVQNSQIIGEWGDTARKINVRSIRKSFLGALIRPGRADRTGPHPGWKWEPTTIRPA
jgi:hypothetical protein